MGAMPPFLPDRQSAAPAGTQELVATYHIYDAKTPKRLTVDMCHPLGNRYRSTADRHRPPANRYQPYLRYTAPQMIGAALQLTGAALQLIGTNFTFDIPPLR